MVAHESTHVDGTFFDPFHVPNKTMALVWLLKYCICRHKDATCQIKFLRSCRWPDASDGVSVEEAAVSKRLS